MLIPGEPLLCPPERPLRLPGIPTPTRRLRLRHVIVAALSVVSAWWLVAFVFADPIGPDTCIGLPDASYPILDYRGFDGAWTYNGAVIGYTKAEDDPCLSPNPIG